MRQNVANLSNEDFIRKPARAERQKLPKESFGLPLLPTTTIASFPQTKDMVKFFGENLEGYEFTEKAWVQSYGTRCVKPPIFFGDIRLLLQSERKFLIWKKPVSE